MITIITRSKLINWNYKRLIKNLITVAGAILILGIYFYISNMDYQILIGK